MHTLRNVFLPYVSHLIKVLGDGCLHIQSKNTYAFSKHALTFLQSHIAKIHVVKVTPSFWLKATGYILRD